MRTLAIATATLLAACGGTSPVSLGDRPSATRDAYCRHYAKCGMVESLDACRAVGPGIFLGSQVSEQAAVEMGKVTYDGERTASCLDAFADRSCDVTSQSGRIDLTCDGEFTGTVPGGGACAFDAECVSRSCNAPTTCQMACCTGTCVGDTPPGDAKLGEACDHARCAVGSFCDGVTFVCAALKPSGAFCGGPQECQYGLDCDPGGSCVALPGPGAPCTGACRDDGTTCSSATGTCVKVGLAGAACATSQDCSPVYHCDDTRHCSAGLALGAACAANQHCAGDGAFCDVADGAEIGLCVLPQPDGHPCQRDPSCTSAHCDPLTLRCAPAPVCL